MSEQKITTKQAEIWRVKIEDISEAIRGASGSCVFLIGAGCSVSAGIPTAATLIKTAIEKFPQACGRIDDLTNYNRIMGALTPVQREGIILPYIEQAKINWAHLGLAQLLKNKYIDRVLSVNFDPLAVRACGLVGEFPAIYDLATTSTFKGAKIANPSITYINGQHTGFVILNTEQELNDHKARINEIIKATDNRRTWVIVGYSGVSDPILDAIGLLAPFAGGLYWVGHDDSPPIGLKPLLDKSENYVKFIGGQDADKFFTELAQELNCFPPTFIENPIGHLSSLLEQLSPPKEEFASVDITTLRSRLTKANRTFAKAGVVSLRKLMLSEKYSEAIQLFKTFGQKTTKDMNTLAAWAYISLAGELVSIKKFQEAYANFESAFLLKPDMYEVLNNWGNALNYEAQALSPIDLVTARKKFKDANEKYFGGLKLKPNNESTLNNWGNSLFYEGVVLFPHDPDAAIKLWRVSGEKYAASMKFRPDSHRTLFNWGNAISAEANALPHTELKNARKLWRSARKKYFAALKIMPNKYSAMYTLGNSLFDEAKALSSNNKYAALKLLSCAKEQYAAALVIKPDLYLALNSWGNALFLEARTNSAFNPNDILNLYHAAIEKYANALKIKPDLHVALINWADVLCHQANLVVLTDRKKACELLLLSGEKYDAVLNLMPDMHEAMSGLGAILINQFQFGEKKPELLDRARAVLERCESIKAGGGAFNLACLYAIQNDVTAAIKWLGVCMEHKTLDSEQQVIEEKDFDGIRNDPLFKRWIDNNFSGKN